MGVRLGRIGGCLRSFSLAVDGDGMVQGDGFFPGAGIGIFKRVEPLGELEFFGGKLVVFHAGVSLENEHELLVVEFGLVDHEEELLLDEFPEEGAKIHFLVFGSFGEKFPIIERFLPFQAGAPGEVLEVEVAQAVVMDFEAKALGRR